MHVIISEEIISIDVIRVNFMELVLEKKKMFILTMIKITINKIDGENIIL